MGRMEFVRQVFKHSAKLDNRRGAGVRIRSASIDYTNWEVSKEKYKQHKASSLCDETAEQLQRESLSTTCLTPYNSLPAPQSRTLSELQRLRTRFCATCKSRSAITNCLRQWSRAL